MLKASGFKRFANGVQRPGFLVQDLVCPMLGSHQLPGSRCTVVPLRQEWGWEESSLVVFFFDVHPWGLPPCSEAAGGYFWAEVNSVGLPGACKIAAWPGSPAVFE